MTNTTRKAIEHLQKLLLAKFGKGDAATIFITADGSDMTDDHATLVARGPARVATVLRRKRKSK